MRARFLTPRLRACQTALVVRVPSRRGSKGKQVGSLRGPATVAGKSVSKRGARKSAATRDESPGEGRRRGMEPGARKPALT